MYSTNIGASSADIAKRIKADLQNPANRIEGSFAADNVQAVAKEIYSYYMYVTWLQKMHYAMTATGSYLDNKAAEVGVFRKMAVWAVGSVTFIGKPGTEIPYDFEVRSETQRYKTTESGTIPDDGRLTLRVEAFLPGKDGNVPEGTITAFDNLPGLDAVINEAATEGGAEAENDDGLRERTLLRMRYPGTSGNQYHYMHWALEVEGVGRVKVFPLWKGPGTVKVSILDSNQRIATPELINKVLQHIDPTPRTGEALAPIGAYLTVSTATAKPINVTATVTVEDDNPRDKADIKADFVTQLQAYFDEIAYTKRKHVTVAKLIDILWAVEGVADIPTFDAGSGNVALGDEEIPAVGTVTLT